MCRRKWICSTSPFFPPLYTTLGIYLNILLYVDSIILEHIIAKLERGAEGGRNPEFLLLLSSLSYSFSLPPYSCFYDESVHVGRYSIILIVNRIIYTSTLLFCCSVKISWCGNKPARYLTRFNSHQRRKKMAANNVVWFDAIRSCSPEKRNTRRIVSYYV